MTALVYCLTQLPAFVGAHGYDLTLVTASLFYLGPAMANLALATSSCVRAPSRHRAVARLAVDGVSVLKQSPLSPAAAVRER